MLNWTDGNPMVVELRMRELRARAEQERLIRQARSARPRPAQQHWRRRIGTALASLVWRPTNLRGHDIDLCGLEDIAP